MRNFNKEFQDNIERKYAYDFDDLLRHYMMLSMEPFIENDAAKVLEMGCYKGNFTQLLAERFSHVTVIEASAELVEVASNKVGSKVKFITSMFEEYDGADTYDYIFLMHTLEHLDDPAGVLAKTKTWLTEKGKLFLICPNANAPSRQIAVKMGLITHNAAITPGEKEHGHRNTYSLDTLEREAAQAGLNTVHRTGIFFKAFANYQWDRLLQTDIISKEYLDGCFKVGQLYPDLCASIMLVCTK